MSNLITNMGKELNVKFSQDATQETTRSLRRQLASLAIKGLQIRVKDTGRNNSWTMQTIATTPTEIQHRASHIARSPLIGHSCLDKVSENFSLNKELPVDPEVSHQGIYIPKRNKNIFTNGIGNTCSQHKKSRNNLHVCYCLEM